MSEKFKTSLPLFMVFLPAVLQSFAWPFAHFIFRVFGKLKIEGKENLKNLQKGIIFAANHANEMDPILMRAILPMCSKHSPMFYVARQRSDYTWKGWRSFVYGDGFFKAWGAYPAYKGDKDYKISLRNFVSLCDTKQTICIFPSGIKRIPIEEVDEVRGGVGFLASISGNPVIPIYIEGTLGTTWSSLFKFQNTILVRIGEPVFFQNVNQSSTVEECKEMAEIVWKSILQLKKK